MGRIFLVDLEERDITNCYLCKVCRTQIASVADFIRINVDFEFAGGVFEKAVNVLVDPPDKHRASWIHTVADVRCVTCCTYLGFKYIHASIKQNVLQHNMVKLIMSKLTKKVGNSYLDGRIPDLVENTSYLSDQV